MIKIGIRSVNLTKRNELVYKRFFNRAGRNGRFSAWVNDMMNQGFTLNSAEALRNLIEEQNKDIEKREKNRDELVKKLRVLVDKKRLKGE